jgi:ABC-type transport system involved in cytochrome bd biosynthesis fused ATPase/permease subunit
MEPWLVAPLAGGCTVAFGLFLLRTHVNSWNQQQADESLDDHERAFFERRYRRRMQTSAVLIGIGAMLSVADQLPLGKPLWLTVYLALLLLSTLWIAFQALSDMAQTKFHSRANLARIRRKQRELQEELSGLRDQNR